MVAHPPDDHSSTVTVTFDGKGNVEGKVNDERIVQGKYKSEGDRIELLDQTGPMACAAGQNGTYTRKVDWKKVVVTVIKDECEARVNALTTFAWTMK